MFRFTDKESSLIAQSIAVEFSNNKVCVSSSSRIFDNLDIEYEFSSSVKRGLAYYVTEGFEISVPSLGAQKQVLGGGEYAEGIGFAIGIDRLSIAIQEKEQ